jgi:phytoene/squalene synthetase
MKTASEFRSGKGENDENFPVASHLIAPRHRGPILAFYRFVRTADDIADHPTLSPAEKIDLIDKLGHALTGEGPPDDSAEPLRLVMAERNLSPRHALDILDAFRLDAQIARYADWPDLISYCALSAMPVGRFVLDVHGEHHTTWPASDALCAALQVINHLQDWSGLP